MTEPWKLRWPSNFAPHLSFLYGLLPVEQLGALEARLRVDMSERAVLRDGFAATEIVAVCTEGKTTPEWYEAARARVVVGRRSSERSE